MRTNFLSVLAITAILFASCSSNEDVIPEANDVRVQFSSGVTATSRVSGATGTTWDAGDAIGIYMVENGGTTVSGSASNVRYTTAGGDGTNPIPFTSTTPISYPASGSSVDFIAYHPHSALTGYSYSVDVSNQASQTAIDLMTAKADNGGTGYDKTNTSAVNLPFKHQLAKVIVNVEKGASLPVDLTGLTVKIKGMNTTATFDVSNPASGFSSASTVAAITPLSSATNTYEAILLPVTLGNTHVVEFVIGSVTYTWNMTDNSKLGGGSITEFESGKKYTFTVTIEAGVKVTGTIEEWGDGGSGTGSAF